MSATRDLTTLELDLEAPEVIRAVQVVLYMKCGPDGYTGLPLGVSISDDQRDLLDRHRGVLTLLRPGLTWAHCPVCDRGRLLKGGSAPTICGLTFACEGRYVVAKTPRRAQVEGAKKRSKKAVAAESELTLFDQVGTTIESIESASAGSEPVAAPSVEVAAEATDIPVDGEPSARL